MAIRNTSYADFIADWRRLLAALDANPDELPDLTDLRPSMESILDALETVVTRQDALRVESKENAAYARELLIRGSDMALQIRAALRSHLGPRNPKLAEYRVRVLGQRRPRPNPEPTEAVEAKASGTGRRRRRSKAEAEPEPEPEESEAEPTSP